MEVLVFLVPLALTLGAHRPDGFSLVAQERPVRRPRRSGLARPLPPSTSRRMPPRRLGEGSVAPHCRVTARTIPAA